MHCTAICLFLEFFNSQSLTLSVTHFTNSPLSLSLLLPC